MAHDLKNPGALGGATGAWEVIEAVELDGLDRTLKACRRQVAVLGTCCLLLGFVAGIAPLVLRGVVV